MVGTNGELLAANRYPSNNDNRICNYNFTNNSGWGRAEWGNEGWGVNETEVNVTATALPMTIAQGDETATAEVNAGWSRAAWGDQVWGDTDEAAAINWNRNVCNSW